MTTPHICQRIAISANAAITALSNPLRGDMVAALGETTGLSALERMRKSMLLDKTGRRILREQPIISSSTLNMNKLSNLPSNSFGFAYISFLNKFNITPDSRANVKYIGDKELAYVMTRYRQVHDFWHVLVQLPITVEAEIGLKWFEYFQTGLPMTALAALFGPLNLTIEQRNILVEHYIPWAINCANSSKSLMNVYYEDKFEVPLIELQKELGILPISNK